MKDPTIIFIRSSVFDRSRQWIFSDEGISYENSDLKGAPLKKIRKEEIEDIRYGVKWIKGLEFIIGRVYCIDIRTIDKEIIKIRMKTLYGVRKKELAEKYGTIFNLLFDYYFEEKVISYIREIDSGGSVCILGTICNRNGIKLHAQGEQISWNDLGSRAYSTYYALFSKSSTDTYKAFDYLTDWNTAILYGITRTYLQQLGFPHETIVTAVS